MKYVLLLLFTLSCFAQSYSEIGVEKFKKILLDKKFDGVVIDVRTPMEQLETGIIEGAQIKNAHEDDWDKYIAKLDKKRTYYVYCAVGGRSGFISNKLSEKGLKAINIDGGMNAWKAKKFKTKKLSKDHFKK